jgi:hypothetical protein
MPASRHTTWDGLAVLKLFDDVHQHGFIDGNLKIQKLAFLLELKGQKRKVRVGHMRFSRYRYGPYSWELPDLVEFLETGEFITRTAKTLTKRGRFVLEYALPEIGDVATNALDLTAQIAKDYGSLPGANLKNLVYSMRVPVYDKGGAQFRVKDLPIGIDILRPSAMPDLIEPSESVAPLLDDLASEFSLSARDVDPTNPRIKRATAQAVVRAANELTH